MIKQSIYIRKLDNSKMEVTNAKKEGQEYIVQETADIHAWGKLEEGQAIECRDPQGAAVLHAHLLCWHLMQGADIEFLKPLAMATMELLEKTCDILERDECTCGECESEPEPAGAAETPKQIH